MSASEIEKLELTQSEFRQNRLTTMTPNVLSFGTHHCHSIAYYQVDFVSAKDNKRHELMKKVAAPIDKRQHTYRLQWQSDSDLYQIMQDGEVVVSGSIYEDFSGFEQENETREVSRLTSKQQRDLAQLRQKLAQTPEFIPDVPYVIEDHQSDDYSSIKPNPAYFEILKAITILESADQDSAQAAKDSDHGKVAKDRQLAGQLSEPIVALGLQIELSTPGVLFDDFLLETDEPEEE